MIQPVGWARVWVAAPPYVSDPMLRQGAWYPVVGPGARRCGFHATGPCVPRKPRAVLRHRRIERRGPAGADPSSGSQGWGRSARRLDRVDDRLDLRGGAPTRRVQPAERAGHAHAQYDSTTLGASGRHARTAPRVLANLPAERQGPLSP